ncbi:MAG: O-antigen ligase family protein [Terracidiphilus sp.]
MRFFLRYPIFLLAFGPPEFKPPIVGIDTSKAHFDAWNVIQVSWLSVVALRAILRLVGGRPILMTRQIRSVLKLAFILGFLFLASVAYSPGRVISAEYCFLYFLNLTCIVEFVSESYRKPPDWMQCIFQLRLVSTLLTATVLLTAFLAPTLVIQGNNRLMGGSVAAVPLYSPLIAITSAYSFLHSLEPRIRSGLFFLLGLGCTVATQTRGVEISLLAILAMAVIGWGKMRRQFAFIVASGLMAATLFSCVAIEVIGGPRIWQAFNRGQDTETLITASGRTGVWQDQILYCVSHPEGMGYIAGVRAFHRRDYATNLHAALTNIGGTDNSYIEVLTDAGWPALAIYLAILSRTIFLGWRFSRKRELRGSPWLSASRCHPLRCSLLLLLFCLAEGTESSTYVIPMSGSFYCQNILLSIILGISTGMVIGSRSRTSRSVALTPPRRESYQKTA